MSITSSDCSAFSCKELWERVHYIVRWFESTLENAVNERQLQGWGDFVQLWDFDELLQEFPDFAAIKEAVELVVEYGYWNDISLWDMEVYARVRELVYWYYEQEDLISCPEFHPEKQALLDFMRFDMPRQSTPIQVEVVDLTV